MRQLKVSHIILITYLLLSSCEQEHEKNLASNLAQINLEFLDYNKNLHKSFLDITIENGVAPIKEQLKIDDNGTASYSFINDKTREILISFEHRKFSQFISPGEALNAELVINELLEYKSNLTHSKIVSGANIETNNLILNYTYTLDSLINNSTAGTSNNGTVSEMEYQEIRLTQMRNQLDELKSLLENNKISNKAFINWCIAQINYRAGYDLSLYPVMQINRSKDDKSPYFDFVNKLSKDSEIQFLSH